MKRAVDYLREESKLSNFERSVALNDVNSIYSIMEDFVDHELNSRNTVLNAYLVNVDSGQIVVMAENIASAFDKLDDAGFKNYSFDKSNSLEIL